MNVLQAFSIFVFAFYTQSSWAVSYPILIGKGEPISYEAYLHYKEGYHPYHMDKKDVPKVKTHSDGTIEVIYSDQHSVTIGEYTSLLEDLKIPGKINEITCLPLQLRTECNAKQDVLVKNYRLIWKNHPDLSKIGKMVLMKTQGQLGTGEAPLRPTFFASYENSFRKFKPKSIFSKQELVKLNPSQIQCDSYEWYDQLTQNFSSNPDELRLNEWSIEEMTDNPETMQSENRTSQAHLGIGLNRIHDGLEIQNIEFPSLDSNNTIFLFFGDIVGWHLLKGPKVCDLSFSFDTAALTGLFNTSQQELNDAIFKQKKITTNNELNQIVGFNVFNAQNTSFMTGKIDDIETLALLGIYNGSTPFKEVPVNVIMIDGSIAKLNLQVYDVQLMRPVL